MEKQDALNPCKFQQMFKYSCDFAFNQSSFFEMHFGILLQNWTLYQIKYYFSILYYVLMCLEFSTTVLL
jgi:hypothetical protein